CATQGGVESEPAPVEERPTGAQTDDARTEGAQAGGASAQDGFTGAELDDPASPLSQRGIDFDIDSNAIRPEYNDVLPAHGDDLAAPLARRVIHFDSDSNATRPEYTHVLAAHGDYLAAHPDVRVTVEGHTDERGSQEYNLALGERRADAVKRVLVLNGAA